MQYHSDVPSMHDFLEYPKNLLCLRHNARPPTTQLNLEQKWDIF
jgi:hypothetical protein